MCINVQFCSFCFQVSIFQVVKNPGKPDNFTFTVDGSLRNITAYITGDSSLTFDLTSPTGVVTANVLQIKCSFDCFVCLLLPPSIAIRTIFNFVMFLHPPGVSQSSSQTSGPLASLTKAGNLRRLSLNTDNQTGSWQISVNSNKPYSVKVTGQ